MTEPAPRRWKQRLVHEMYEYLLNFAFLALFLVAFAWYRRLILAAYHIRYLGYWAPMIEAAILAKVIMLGDALRIGRSFHNRPLAVSALYRAVAFSLLAVLFTFLEHIAGAMIHGRTAAEGLAEIASKGLDENLAWYVVVLVAFLPFFAMKEIERTFGADRVRGLFFRGRADENSSPSADLPVGDRPS